MTAENPTWGAPRVHGARLMRGFRISERTVSRLTPRAPRRALNGLEKLSKKHQSQARLMLRAIPGAETAEQASRLKTKFQKRCRQRGQNDAAELIDHDWERVLTAHRRPRAHWKRLRTSHAIGPPFAALRLRTAAVKRFKRVTGATAMIYKPLLVAQQKFGRLNAPERLKDVLRGVK